MLNLIKLEIRKYRWKGYVFGVITCNIAVMAIVGLIYFAPKIDKTVAVEDEILTFSYAFQNISGVVNTVFVIFASVLLANMVIDEFKSKTATLLFTYPINRKKLIASKLLLVGAWTFAMILISTVLQTAAVIVLDSMYGYYTDHVNSELLIKHGLKSIVYALAAVGTSFIPLAIGMWRKSVPATIISSIVISMVVSSNSGEFSLMNYIYVPVSLAVIGLLVAYLSFRRLEQVDIV